jgi:cell division ATPase FtsA
MIHKNGYNVKKGVIKMIDQLKESIDELIRFAEMNPDCFVKVVKTCTKNENGVSTIGISLSLSIIDDNK